MSAARFWILQEGCIWDRVKKLFALCAQCGTTRVQDGRGNHPTEGETMKIEIHDCKTGATYIVESREECRDGVDAQVFDLVLMFHDTITMGSVIGSIVR